MNEADEHMQKDLRKLDQMKPTAEEAKARNWEAMAKRLFHLHGLDVAIHLPIWITRNARKYGAS